ncbi:hypothetical protein ACQPW1_18710 [Nocardia sp. CA-128927]|uniref:hypothetical protein n=1 Tax=Nocardia sp. CA-128927 TaxID=3239975 RepID=UPI003D99D7B3
MTKQELPEEPTSEADNTSPAAEDLRHLAELVVLDDTGKPMPYEEAAAWLAENVDDRKEEFRSYLTDDPQATYPNEPGSA